MHQAERNLLIVAAGVVAFAAVYAINPPAPRYLPLEGAWRWTAPAGEPSMAWYGRVAWGSLAAALGATAMWVAVRFRPRTDAARLPGWAIALATLAIVVASLGLMALIVAHEFSHWGVW